jgi:hypothetical protein
MNHTRKLSRYLCTFFRAPLINHKKTAQKTIQKRANNYKNYKIKCLYYFRSSKESKAAIVDLQRGKS